MPALSRQPKSDADFQAMVAELLEQGAAVQGIAPNLETPKAPASSLDMAERFRHFPQAVPDFHRVWYDALDSGPSHLMLLAPREHAKTSVVLTYALYRLVSNRQTRIGIFSKSEDLAKGFLRELTHELEDNAALIAACGRFKPQSPTRWSTNEIVIDGAGLGKDVSVFAVGVGGQVTGRRADVAIFDDIETMETLLTPERRARTREWFAKEALPILSPTGKAVIIGTKKHEDDLYGWLGKDGSGWYVLANATRVIKDDGTALWPDLWSLEDLAKRKAELDAVNLRAWSSEYMNEVVPSETQMYHPELWPSWNRLPERVVYYQAWDLAISMRTSADYTVGVCIAVDAENTVYIVDCRRGHWSFDETQKQMKSFAELYHPATIGIETAGYQNAAVQEMVRTSMLPIKPLPPGHEDKVARGTLLEARAAMGKVLRPANLVPWWPLMASELSFFPQGTHDDQVDALSYALLMTKRQRVYAAY